jgi:hypothetical protein
VRSPPSRRTQTDFLDQIIDVDQHEAEWTLEIVDRLFDYFIVEPTTDREIRESIDEELREADRTPRTAASRFTPDRTELGPLKAVATVGPAAGSPNGDAPGVRDGRQVLHGARR